MNTRRLILTASVVALAGCAGPTQTQYAKMSGRGEKPTEYEKKIKEYLWQNLKDPNSVMIQSVVGPSESVSETTDWLETPGLISGGRRLTTKTDIWLVTAQVNAKNSYGGYVGWEDYVFHFRGEKLIFAENVTAETARRKKIVEDFVNRR